MYILNTITVIFVTVFARVVEYDSNFLHINITSACTTAASRVKKKLH